MNIWNCPHGKAFMRSLCRLQEAGDRHVMVRLPERHMPSFLKEFCGYSTRFFGTVQKVILEDDQPLAKSLAPVFMSNGVDSPLLEDYFTRTVKNSPNLLLVLPPKSPVAASDCRKFLEMAAAHAKAFQDEDKRLLWSMVAVLPVQFDCPQEEIGLESWTWWGHLHPSDLEFSIEQALADITNEAAYYWYSALCKGLARMDPELVDAIVLNPPTSVEELADVVQDSQAMFSPEVIDLACRYLQDPPSALRRDTLPKGEVEAALWKYGALDINCYGKPSLHPAVLVAAGHKEQLEKLVIQGQMQIYLPLVQEVHNFLCRTLTDLCGPDWSTRDTTKFQSVEQEIGALPLYMKTEFGMNIPKSLIDLAYTWREVRNVIAHNRMIPCYLTLRAVLRYGEARQEFSSHE